VGSGKEDEIVKKPKEEDSGSRSSRAAAQSSWGVSVEERKRFARRKTIDFMEPAPEKKNNGVCAGTGPDRGGRPPKVRDILHRPVGPVLTVRWPI
jgi:hypothetical protein